MARPADMDDAEGLIINAEVLRFVLRYEPDTGLFFWRHKRTGVCTTEPAGTIRHGYVVIRVFYRQYQAQRLAWLYEHGVWPTGIVDHINRNRSDNRICNLRDATCAQNAWNSVAYKAGRSGFAGVRHNKKRGFYEAYLKIDSKKTYLGSFPTAEEASRHREMMALATRGDFHPQEASDV